MWIYIINFPVTISKRDNLNRQEKQRLVIKYTSNNYFHVILQTGRYFMLHVLCPIQKNVLKAVSRARRARAVSKCSECGV
jgi:hypothetical protein